MAGWVTPVPFDLFVRNDNFSADIYMRTMEWGVVPVIGNDRDGFPIRAGFHFVGPIGV